MPSSRSTSSVLSVLVVAPLAMALAGCNGGHGKFTSEQLSEAQQRIAVLKSGTEWEMAHQQFLAGDLDKSLKTIDQSLAMNGGVAKSHVLRGRIMLEKSRLEEARQEFLTAQKLAPKLVDAPYYLGIVYERVNQPDDALACYRTAMELDPANAQYVVAASEMLISQHRLDDADKLLLERRQFLPYSAAIRQSQGQILQLRGESARAAQVFTEALLLAPGDLSITEDLVQAQMASGQFADAETHIGKLLDIDANQNRRDLKAMRAKCFVALNRPVDARTILEELTSDKDGTADLRAWIDLGNVCAILHDKGGLRSAMQRVMAMAPDRPDGYMLKAMFCRQDNRLADALSATDQAISKVGGGGSSPTAAPFVMKAIILQDQGHVPEARAVLVQSQQVEPHNQQVAAFISAIDGGTVASHPDAER